MNNTLAKLDNLLEHKELVKFAGIRLGKRLIQNNEESLGLILIARSYKHDQSKFFGKEFDNLNGFVNSEPELKEAICHHRSVNDHHPEYMGKIQLMSDYCLTEFICDIWARCALTGQDVREWLRNEGTRRYNLTDPSKTMTRIMFFVDLLIDQPAKRIG